MSYLKEKKEWKEREAQFHVGDICVFRDWDDMEVEFGLTGSGNIECRAIFVIEMASLCGHIVRITSIEGQGTDTCRVSLSSEEGGYVYGLQEYAFSPDMLLPFVHSEEPILYVEFNADDFTQLF